jgi:hypothetical protein
VDFTVNSKMVTGDWIRPKRIENSVIDEAAEIEYEEKTEVLILKDKEELLNL